MNCVFYLSRKSVKLWQKCICVLLRPIQIKYSISISSKSTILTGYWLYSLTQSYILGCRDLDLKIRLSLFARESSQVNKLKEFKLDTQRGKLGRARTQTLFSSSRNPFSLSFSSFHTYLSSVSFLVLLSAATPLPCN